MFCRKAYLVFLFILSGSLLLSAQRHLFDARLISTEDGLPNMLVRNLYKDRQGFLWIATQYGLVRYDGLNFNSFTREKNGLSSNDGIRYIKQDRAGNLWLYYLDQEGSIHNTGILKQLDIFDTKNSHAVPFDDYFAGKAPVKSSDLLLLKATDPLQRQWFCTTRGELYCYDGEFKKVFSQPGAVVSSVTVSPAGAICLAIDNKVIQIDTSGRILKEITASGIVTQIFIGQGNALYISHLTDKGLQINRFSPEKGLVPFQLFQNGRSVTIPASEKLFLFLSKKGYWYIEIDKQLNVFSSTGEWLFNYHSLLGKENSVSILGAIEDDTYLWAATAIGIIQANITDNPFHVIYKRQNGLSDCRGLTEDNQANVYFIDAFLYKYQPATGQVIKKEGVTDASHGLIYTDGIIWGGYYSNYFLGFEWNAQTEKSIQYATLTKAQHSPFCMLESEKNGLLLVGNAAGLTYASLKTKTLIPFDKYNGFDLIKTGEVLFFHKNKTGIWLATASGVYLMNETEGILRQYSSATGDLPFDYIRHIYEDKNGVFWLATKGGGLIRWQPAVDQGRKSAYQQYTVGDGLSNNYTYAVYEDDYERLWVPSDKGLMCIDKNTFKIKTFLKEDGLPHNEFNGASHLKTRDGSLYFGGLGGIITFHPKNILFKEASGSPLELTGFYKLTGKADKMADKTRELADSDIITVRPDDKIIEIHFQLMDFDKEGQHGYAYQIEGFSNNWNYIRENFIRLTNLPYGQYRLKIKGLNKRDGWSDKELVFHLEVLKPFYLQWWFLALLVLAVLGGGRYILIIQARRAKKDRVWLEAEVRIRTSYIEESHRIMLEQADKLREMDELKTRFLSNITHELRTPLTLIMAPIEQLRHEKLPVLIQRRLNGIYNNTRHLLELINQLLDLSRLDSQEMRKEINRGEIVHYTRALLERFQPLIERKKLRIAFVSGQKSWLVLFDQDKWNKIVYNLLSNAVKFTPENGIIQVVLGRQLRDDQEYIYLAVKDTGMGIPENNLTHIFDRFYQADNSSTRTHGGSGIGLALVKELAELQKGKVYVSSKTGMGTTFEVVLPVMASESAMVQPIEVAVENLPIPVYDTPQPAYNMVEPQSDETQRWEILLVDDNHEMREYIRHCLESAVYSITEAKDGEEGLAKALELVPDLIISDVMMPRLDGFMFTRAVRSNISISHIPIILLTARNSVESRIEGLQHGADIYLAKPFSPYELSIQIQNLLESRRILQQRYQNAEINMLNDLTQQEDTFIIELREYVIQHLNDIDLNGDSIGKHFNMSRVNLYRKLKALTNMSISEFIKTVRLEKAMEMLKENKYSISEVTYKAGFSSPSFFARTFKQAYGKAPSEVEVEQV